MHKFQTQLNEAIASFQQGKPVIFIDDEEASTPVLALSLTSSVESIEQFLNLVPGTLGICLTESTLLEKKLPLPSYRDWDMQRCTFGPKSSSSDPSEISKLFKSIQSSGNLSVTYPGRFYPLKYEQGGTLKCASPVEASIDLCLESDLFPGTMIGALKNEEQVHSLDFPIISITEYVKKLRSESSLIEQVATARLPTKHGDFKVFVFESHTDNTEHIALVKGELPLKSPTLVRMHSECITGDIFSSTRCDCGTQLDNALHLISQEGSGVLVYLRGHEGRGIGLTHKLKAYNLQDKGRDTVQANIDLGLPVDKRDYGIGAQILSKLGVSEIRLLSNNPKKYSGLMGYGLKIIERVSLETKPTIENYRYLLTKKEKLGHFIDVKRSDWEKLNA